MAREVRKNMHGLDFTLASDSDAFCLSLSSAEAEKGIMDITLGLKSGTVQMPEETVLSWEWPMVRTHHVWFPGCTDHRITPVWAKAVCRSRATWNAPVLCLYGMDGTNACTLAASETAERVVISAGLIEENAAAGCTVKLFVEPRSPFKEYSCTLRMDFRALPMNNVLGDVSRWWETLPGHTPTPVPEHARLPMYSTWYGFHQRLTPEGIEEQCRLAAEMGMKAVIVDDGWQTDDNSRGYAYCGDWEVTGNKMPDMAGHVKRVHDLGMKYILWFSVPFVGSYSKIYERFKDKGLDTCEPGRWIVLDPRFPDVREYLIGTYERFLKEYDIDGFKLDFVDMFKPEPGTVPKSGNGRDYDSIPAAADRLMDDVITRLRAIKDNVLIEFRQNYTGPLMRKYGNMLRAMDVPNDFAGNRKQTLDIRLLSGNTPAHADMFMWHPDEPVESAAMQILHALFAVPQVSVLLDKIPEDHRRMVGYLMRFWTDHRDLLLDGAMDCPAPHMQYPRVIVRSGGRTLGAAFTDGTVIDLKDGAGSYTVLVNAALSTGITFKTDEALTARTVKTVTCTGQVTVETTRDFGPGVHRIEAPAAGLVFICSGG